MSCIVTADNLKSLVIHFLCVLWNAITHLTPLALWQGEVLPGFQYSSLPGFNTGIRCQIHYIKFLYQVLLKVYPTSHNVFHVPPASFRTCLRSNSRLCSLLFVAMNHSKNSFKIKHIKAVALLSQFLHKNSCIPFSFTSFQHPEHTKSIKARAWCSNCMPLSGAKACEMHYHFMSCSDMLKHKILYSTVTRHCKKKNTYNNFKK